MRMMSHGSTRGPGGQPVRLCVVWLLSTVCLLGAVACGDDDSGRRDTNGESNNTPNNGVNNAPTNNETNNTPNNMVDPARFAVDDCDPLQPEFCALPWPSSRFLTEDESTSTGLRLTFGESSLPATSSGTHVDPTPYQRMDGFAVGSALVAFFENLDASNLPSEGDILSSLAPQAPIVLLEIGEEGVRRVPYWAEVDLQEDDPAQRGLIVRPAEILKEATRYVVGMRGLVDAEGSPISPSPAFEALREGQGAQYDALRGRAERFEEIFGLLEDEGVVRQELVLAWDFVTASSQALHGPALKMRDEGLAALEEEGVTFTVDEVNEFDEDDNTEIAFEVIGTLRVPHFMAPFDLVGNEAWRFNLNDEGEIEQNGWAQAPFIARIPRSAIDGEPAGIVLYGHGLNGSAGQVRGGFNRRVGLQENLIFVATDMWGMSADDVPNILLLVQEYSRFPILAERLVQGLFNHVALIRAARDHLGSLPALTDRGVSVDPERVYYSGISQGGIYGASIVALSPDVTRGHLGVPGQNYSTLLHRSVDFLPFSIATETFYRSSVERLILLGAIQTLWDMSDPGSYYRHISQEPFAETPPGQVLLASATGDYQVALVTNEVVTRSGLGVALMKDYGKEVPGVTPTDYPHTGSGVVNYSFGNPWPPPGNVPPEDEFGDPHGKPRGRANHQQQMIHFWNTGEIIDVCGGDGCTPE